VLLADFGTAFDWTEHGNEITVGAPEAYTKLYVAPEVRVLKHHQDLSDSCVGRLASTSGYVVRYMVLGVRISGNGRECLASRAIMDYH
jgi:hypothetical protein